MGVQSTALASFFSIRMDENYNLLPHGVNFQDAIFPDTQENRRMFSSIFQFSNCSQGQQLATFSSDWEVQEDTKVRIGYTLCYSKIIRELWLIWMLWARESRVLFQSPDQEVFFTLSTALPEADKHCSQTRESSGSTVWHEVPHKVRGQVGLKVGMLCLSFLFCKLEAIVTSVS